MGLRAASASTPTSSAVENENTRQSLESETIATGSDTTTIGDKEEQNILSSPNVSVYSNMAPALTEPLSQTNKLSSSTSSASPRPIANNLINNNSTLANNNDNLSSSGTILLESPQPTNGNNNIFDKKIAKEIGSKGTFQLAFEEVVARQTAAARQKLLDEEGEHNEEEEVSVPASSNGPDQTNQMGPMCEKNSSEPVLDFEKELDKERLEQDKLSDRGEEEENILDQHEEEEEEAAQEEEGQAKQQQNDDLVVIEEVHMDVQSCENQQEDSSNIIEVSTSEAPEIVTEPDTSSVINVNDPSSLKDDNISTEEETLSAEEHPLSDQSKEEVLVENSPKSRIPTPLPQTPLQTSIATTVVSSASTLPQAVPETELLIRRSPPRTPVTTAASLSSPNQQSLSQSQGTPSSCLTPQSTSSGMGLQKDFIKDSAEMDQVLGDMDLLQVLKGFDSAPSGETLCELAGSLGLFNDVDVMNYEEMGTPATNSETKEIRTDIEKRQQQMQRKCDFLLRRLRKIQSRYMGKHASEEIVGLFEWTNRLLRRKDHERQITYDEDRQRPVTTSSMRVLLKRIDSVATNQHAMGQSKKTKLGHLAPNYPADVVKGAVPIISGFDENSTEQIDLVSGMLQTELKQVQSALDSDVTASSSGGESADEMVTYNNQTQQSLSISKRAAWRWARDRAALASRWTWLLAQISDLEYRIRQHNELHHQIKKNKAAVTFEKSTMDVSFTTPVSGSHSSNNTIVQNVPSSVNGYRGVLPGNSKTIDVDTSSVPPNGAIDPSSSNLSGSCRTRPFQRAGFRKRKLLQTANVHTVSKKAARPSTVKCGCQWPLHPCALCTGRPDPTAPRDLPDTMTPSERVALLDPGFHPVLSFPEDISHSIHIEGIARLSDWQSRVLRCSSKTLLKGAVAAQKAAEREDRSKKYLENRRKHNRKYSPQDIMAANKLKNAKNRRALHTDHLIKSKHRKLMSSSSSNAGDALTADRIDNCSTAASGHVVGGNGISSGSNSLASSNSCGNGGGFLGPSDAVIGDNFDGINGILPRSKNSSPTPGSHSGSSHKSERLDRRNHRNSYDIDNIVIPYSIAAATRVEILPYKEIPTPKWRVIEDDAELIPDSKIFTQTSGTVIFPLKADSDKFTSNFTKLKESHVSPFEDVEDISDEAVQIRHDKALLDERKKFQTYLKFPWSTRSRANRRIDSRAESSGANTPDPTSPAPNTPSVAGDQESIPSPAAPPTPQNFLEPADGSDTLNSQNLTSLGNPPPNNISNSAARRIERKRTVSLKKDHSKEEPRRSTTPDPKETIPPFEPLQFPLSEDLYEAMLQMMPNDHQLIEDCLKTNDCDVNNIDGGGDGSVNKSGNICSEPGSTATTTIPTAAATTVIGVGGSGSGLATITGGTAAVNAATTCSQQNAGSSTYDSSAYELIAFDTGDSLMGCESDTDSAESGLLDEDPNDPEWREAA